ncbi:MAG: sugar ABC transporter permease [Armatimonadota bacterium]|nr:sugar ABC transporter permease [Armatimonadota bacterium]MDR7486152.1 sugar ABC transporter permease [Armatimonadota bacterium]MDR7531783.1 sugar ABC transporter permease [Armatimonadota bacterium]MDR7534872.1 sugar ABC transporter permease [Armatimonadota bacterium]
MTWSVRRRAPAAPGARRPPGAGLARQRYRAAAIFLLPATVGIVLFSLLPILQALRLSLFDYSLLSPERLFVGGANYARAAQDPIFRIALRNTLVYAALLVALQTVAALGLALLLKRPVRGLAFFRSAFFIPVVTSLVVISTVWKLMYNSQGVINSVLAALGLPPQPFLASADQALASLVLMSVWKEVGFYMLIFLAGLQAIPGELYESAAIDGATAWQSFWRITLPLLRRAAVFVVVVGTISAFKVFTPVYLMTDGGPADSTMVMVFYIFRTAFRYFEMGFAAAMSFVLLVVVLLLTLVQFRLLRTTVEY